MRTHMASTNLCIAKSPLQLTPAMKVGQRRLRDWFCEVWREETREIRGARCVGRGSGHKAGSELEVRAEVEVEDRGRTE